MAVHSWMPRSPCGPGCVTRPAPSVGRVRAAARLVWVVLALLRSAVTAPLLLALRGRARTALVRQVFRGLLRAVGATLEVHGDTTLGEPKAGPHRGALVVTNHVSWLDVVAVNAVCPMRSVAKKEIGAWPLVGALARRAGTVYLDREALRALPGTVDQVGAALRGGSLVNVSPEGTTWCGLALGRFRAAMFQAAIDGGVPVRPVALRYRLRDGAATTWPAFLAKETLVESVRRTAALRGLVVEMHVLPEIAPGRATDRHELAALAEAAVREALGPEPAPADHVVTLAS